MGFRLSSLVQKEDFQLIEKLMRCWYRVNTQRKFKTLIDVAYDTGNYEIVERLTRYQMTNELVSACFACHTDKVMEFVKIRFGKFCLDISTMLIGCLSGLCIIE